MAPKKAIKMDLGSFLADDSLGGGSWADEEVDMSSIGVSAVAGSTAAVPERQGGSEFGRGGFGHGGSSFGDRGDRKEFPIPDAPPYRARINNLPWDIVEEDVKNFFEKRMQMTDIVTDISLPVDRETGKLRGFGFVTFTERDVLEEALRLSLSDFNGRRVFVNVAAPQRSDGFDGDWRSGGDRRRRDDDIELDWGAARAEQGPLPPRERERGFGRPPRRDRDEPDLDWGSARESRDELPPRERGFGSGRPPRRDREEPDLDWGSARSEQGGLPPRERSFGRQRRERDEPDLDWGAARSEQGGLPPRERSFGRQRRERDEPELDWGAARSEQVILPPRERSNRKPRKEQDLDWSSARSDQATPGSRNASKRNNKTDDKKEDVETPKKSVYDILAIEGDSDEEEEKVPASKQESTKEANTEPSLEQATANLSISNEKEDGWEVVRK